MSTTYHDDIDAEALKAYVINTPLQQLDKKMIDMDDGTHAFSAINVDGGAIDGATIGATTSTAGTFTTLDATGDLDLGSYFKVHLASKSQSVATLATDLVEFDTIRLDNNDDFNQATYYFIPSVAGWYFFVAMLNFTPLAAAKAFKTIITKNAIAVSTGHYVSESATHAICLPFTTIQQANGSTDYFGVEFHNGDTGSVSLASATGVITFMGFRMF